VDQPERVPEPITFADPGDENTFTPAAIAPATLLDRAPSRATLVQWRKDVFNWLRMFASATVYAVLIITFILQVARVDGESMAPTLADHDRVIVNKLQYLFASPQRGDIVMLYYPIDPDKAFVKRVIAEPGDSLRIIDGKVIVNGEAMRDEFVAAEYRSHDDWGPQIVPEGYYYVMGDHRNNSSDSRHWGPVPKRYITGKVQVRWWPVPHARVF